MRVFSLHDFHRIPISNAIKGRRIMCGNNMSITFDLETKKRRTSFGSLSSRSFAIEFMVPENPEKISINFRLKETAIIEIILIIIVIRRFSTAVKRKTLLLDTPRFSQIDTRASKCGQFAADGGSWRFQEAGMAEICCVSFEEEDKINREEWINSRRQNEHSRRANIDETP